MQHWSRKNPCAYCGATSNTGHTPSCTNADLYDDQDIPIPAVPLHLQESRMFTQHEIENRFGFHKGTIEGPNATAPKHAILRQQFKAFATMLDECLPDGRAKSVAFTELENASMWAHKSIAETAPLVDE